MNQFFDECCRMKAFKHPNVVELIGMCLDSPDGFPLMILPLYPNGNLKAYLQKSRVCSPMVTRLPEVMFLMYNRIHWNDVQCASFKILRKRLYQTSSLTLYMSVYVQYFLLCSGYIHVSFKCNVCRYCTRNGVCDRKGICSQRPCCKKLHVSP